MSSLIQYDPLSQLSALHQQFFGDDFFAPLKGINIPTTDVYTKNNELVTEVHLPNFTEDNVNIEVENNALIIQAQLVDKEEDKSKKYVVRESSSSFYRSIQLPERADVNNIQAHLEDGILRVSIPLTPLPEPKRIAINAKNKSSKK